MRKADIDAGIFLGYLAECTDAILHLARDELRDVIGLHETQVIVGIGLGQQEGLRHLSLRIDIGKEGAGVESIQAATAEHDPTTVAAPRVVALHVIAVDRSQGNRYFRSQVSQIEVGILVPDGEVAIARERIKQPTAIRRDPWEGGT